MTTYEITNIDKFTDVDLSLRFYNGAFHGTVSIYTDYGWKDITGEHGANDYEEKFGFKIKQV